MKLLKSTATVGSATILSRILGFLRDVVLARLFGASGETDAFFLAFKIPNFMRRLFAEGSFSLAFVPVLSTVVRLIVSLLVFVATWMAGLEAHDLDGWRGFLLPVAGLLIVVVGVVTLGYLVSGAGFTVESLLREAGLLAPVP